jgi:repressor LexA
MIATMTTAQRATLEAAAAYWQEHGYAPSLRDLADARNLQSVSPVFDNVTVLEAQGYVRQEQMTPRSLRLTSKGWAAAGQAAPCCIGPQEH